MLPRLYLLLALLSITLPSAAYTAADQARLNIKLDTSWQVIGSSDNGKVAKAAYASNTPGMHHQVILDTVTSKDASQSADQQIQQIFTDLKNDLTQRACVVADLTPVSDNNNVYRKWTTSFRCQSPALSGSVVMIDADPKNIFTFVLNTNNYNYTNADHAAALALLKKIMQLCYTDKNCYQV